MLLGFDVGNTHTVMGSYSLAPGVPPKLQQTWRLSTHPICTADELKAKVEMILNISGLQLESFEAITLSSVVPTFTRLCLSAFQEKKPYVIDYTWPFSFQILANPAQQVGADRLVNAETVVREYGCPAIVVDSGTATTVCAISKNPQGQAEYLGGAIIPGIEMSLEALAKKAAQLSMIELSPPPQAIGRNTQEALKSGMMFGYASMIDGMIRRFKTELGKQDLPVIATGGISNLMKGLTQEVTLFDSDLTLKGIAYLYDSIRKR